MRAGLVAAAALATAHMLVPAQAEEQAKPRILAIFAHPDDELIVAPALARAARDGAHVTLVFATSGDQGPGVSGMDKGPGLAAVREKEARCAAAALGAGLVVFLRQGDGTLTNRPQDSGSPASLLAQTLTPMLADDQYDMVITWGPDGGYGHGDHRIVSAIVTQVAQASAQAGLEVLYPGIRAGTLPPVLQMQQWAVTDPSRLPVAKPYDDEDLAKARSAAQCHATQFSEEERAQLADLFHASVWQGAVHFRRAF